MAISEHPMTEADARAALAAEWAQANPKTPAEITEFYRTSRALSDDLEVWHASAARQEMTDMVVYVAGKIEAKSAVDIGCGRGDDLRALAETYPSMHLIGIEPNATLIGEAAYALKSYDEALWWIADDVDCGGLETADLLVCIDVLEHIPDPETWLGKIARRARIGAVLVETCATSDIATPLHLEASRGWHPGHCLELAGWTRIDQRGRVRVWQRVQEAMPEHTSLLLCAYRACEIPTMTAVLQLATLGWRWMPKWGDALISRSRSQIVSQWHAETADDVFLMLDDDILFQPADAIRLVELARETRSIACASYPVGDGSNTAVRAFYGTTTEYGLNLPPKEIEYAATGFVACHRDVIDALAPTLPLCHPDQPYAFRPYFMPMVVPMEATADIKVPAFLSEDWAWSFRARALGFKIMLDPTIRLQHQKSVPLSVDKMHAFHELFYGG